MGVMANLKVTDKDGSLITYQPRIYLNLAELNGIWKIARKEGQRTMAIDGGNIELRYVFDDESLHWAEQRVIV